MLTPGDVVQLDLGHPSGLFRPAVVVTARRVLLGGPNVVQVVPLTRTERDSASEIVIAPDLGNGLGATSSAQCQHIRSVATTRISALLGNVGQVALRQIRDTISLILDL